MTEFWQSLPEPLRTIVLPIFVGALLLCFGWTLYKVGLRAIGFVLGAAIGGVLAYVFLYFQRTSGLREYQQFAIEIVLVSAVVFGVLNAFLIMKIYYVLIGLCLALLGLSIHGNLVEMETFAGLPGGVASFMNGLGGKALVSVISVGIGLLIHRYAIIVISAHFGSVLIYRGLPEEHRIIFLVPTLFLTGLLVQLGFVQWARRKVDPDYVLDYEEEKDDDDE